MNVATSSRVEVGVRDLKNNLSRYLNQVEAGVEVVVTVASGRYRTCVATRGGPSQQARLPIRLDASTATPRARARDGAVAWSAADG